MNARFKKYLLASTATHVGILVVLVVGSVILHLRARRKPHEIVTYVDIQTAVPAPPSVVPVEEIEKPEPPEPEAEPEPPRDIPEPESEPRKKKLQKSTKRIKRPAPTPKRPALSEEEIRKLLESELERTASASPTSTDFPFSWYLSLVRQRMYEAWNQPSELSGTAGLRTTVEIRVSRDGTITGRNMVHSSGNPVMDESVMRAVAAVSQLKPLPAQYTGSHRDITIEFELTGSAAL